MNTLITALLALAFISPLSVLATEFHQRQEVQDFIRSLSERHQMDTAELQQLFRRIEIRQDIIDAINKPAEAKPWHQYRPIFVTDSRADDGVKFMHEHHQALRRAEEKYGVDAEVITAIIGVESRYGKYRGRYRVMDALATLGFEYPRRSKFFRKELEQFLLLSREESFDPFAIMGSYAGAMGKPQFIASSYRAYAVDFDGDGVRDLLNNATDAIGSVASYLARHGWQRGQLIAVPATTNQPHTLNKKALKPKVSVEQWQQKGVTPNTKLDAQLKVALISLNTQDGREYWFGTKNFYAITRYNHSPLYAMAVYQLSQSIKARL